MGDTSPVVVPDGFTKVVNTNHLGVSIPIAQDASFNYGTAGFRTKSANMTFIAYRVGYLANLRARQQNAAIGVMITASHNPNEDNGVKMIDPNGEMLSEEWESYASDLIKENDDNITVTIRALETNDKINAPCFAKNASVLCAMDTRDSGPHLMKAIEEGCKMVSPTVPFINFGILTTPQLHYLVKATNDESFGSSTKEGYYERLSSSFLRLQKFAKSRSSLIIDCANGVGADRMKELNESLMDAKLDIHFINDGNGILNHECGADFIKTKNLVPKDFPTDVAEGVHCASFDGDADRLIYFVPEKGSNSAYLLDGDRIAALFATYVQKHLSASGLSSQLTFGVVQTAYTNGNCMKFIQNLEGVEHQLAKTGVKHLERLANKYDIGIYFEANGHGTIHFGRKFSQLITSIENEHTDRLKELPFLINPLVGDAMSDLLAVEFILSDLNITANEWFDMYELLPCGLVAMQIDESIRSKFMVSDDDSYLIEPSFIQVRLNEYMASNGCRIFMRPSGTEAKLRVYAEADRQELVNEAMKFAESVIHQYTSSITA